MLIDHTGLALCDNNQVMRSVGRLAFPIFAFFLAEGVRHTSDVRRYMTRMAVLAIVSEVPFDMAIYKSVVSMESQNVFFTLLMGLFAVTALSAHERMTGSAKLTRLECILGRHWTETLLLSMIIAEFMRTDYGAAGVAVIVLFYEFIPLGAPSAPAARLPVIGGMAAKDSTISLPLLIAECICLTVLDGAIYFMAFGGRELYALLSIIPLALYSGERGRLRLKYAFYLFYPIHLFIIGIARVGLLILI